MDSSLGFDPNHEKELFEKFTLRSRLGTANEPSNGIGLYLCKKIIEKYKGELLAESDGLNMGSKFSILFNTVK
jgi:signal transduction histidine kinase